MTERTPPSEARDAFLIGVSFLLYGLFVWWVMGGRLRDLLPRPSVPRAIRDAFNEHGGNLTWGTPDDKRGSERLMGTDNAG